MDGLFIYHVINWKKISPNRIGGRLYPYIYIFNFNYFIRKKKEKEEDVSDAS